MESRGLLEIAAEYSMLTANRDTHEMYGGDVQPRLDELAANWEAGLAEYVRRQNS